MNDLDALFESMAKSTSSIRSDYFRDGQYVVQPKSFEFRQGFKGKSFIAQFKVTKSSNPEIPVGSTRSWIVKLDGSKDQVDRALGDIKNLFFALQGKNPSSVPKPELDPKTHAEATKLWKCSIDPEFAKANGVDSDLLLGIPVELEATTVAIPPSPRKPQGGEFTRHAWSPASE